MLGRYIGERGRYKEAIMEDAEDAGGCQEDTLENAGDTRRVQWRMHTICGGCEADTLESAEYTRKATMEDAQDAGGCQENTLENAEDTRKATMEDAEDMLRM